jgi:hypothetical protein
MENNKYYTPTIDDFHVGFEYEKNEPHRIFYKENMPVEHKWATKKWDEKQDRIGTLRCKIQEKQIRVKYLDKKDIESLGFKETETINFFELDNKQESYLSWYPETNRVEIGDNECSGGFSGTIKNKSELVKLLKQLGI